jgi:hypothetical protein
MDRLTVNQEDFQQSIPSLLKHAPPTALLIDEFKFSHRH